MLSDDVYKSRLERTVTEIEYWLGEIVPAARNERGWTGPGWRLMLEPHVRQACPLELLLRLDQRMDLVVADTECEELEVRDLELVLEIIKAVCAGDVVIRVWSSTATAIELGREVLIDLGGRGLWRHATPDLDALPDDIAVATDRRFVAYLRT